MANDIPLAPVSGWEVRSIPAYGALMLRLDYLIHPTQSPEDAQHSPNFLIAAPQLRELIQTLEQGLKKLEDGPPQGTGLPKH